ncbi:A disintegrin and metalloproteinase with thrombospondin motifs 14 [Mizuhopecten yessoensis]|uniref:A disintegrin and metalloproteinase with thrombospondin motifs 14 n=1 Tax=Mizuhopecten yessoensis TaxID=6573 RepID=A0A210R1U4_MIZYE|nr:A disintegrin and metalloproteinase with thrombospondin motifs 14 [Mizuhopecten yessoensis]
MTKVKLHEVKCDNRRLLSWHGVFILQQYDIDFRWSAWSEFLPCSRSCGIGIKRRYRTCYRFGRHPTPVDGELCRGDAEHYHTCNIQECPEGSLDFRRLQCAFFNGLSHNNRKHSWKPFITDQLSPRSRPLLHPCSLVCSAVGVAGLVVKFTSQVVDGTSCNQGNRRQVCVKGQCQTLGCDQDLASSAAYDRCGVCDGDGTSCDVISSSISQILHSGYRTLLEIEAGSRNIHIRQTSGPEATVGQVKPIIELLGQVKPIIETLGRFKSISRYYDKIKFNNEILGQSKSTVEILGQVKSLSRYWDKLSSTTRHRHRSSPLSRYWDKSSPLSRYWVEIKFYVKKIRINS